MKKVYRTIALMGLMFSCAAPLLAQPAGQATVTPPRTDSTTNRQGLRVGLNLGLTQLYGDLSTPNLSFGAGLNVSYPLGSVVAVTLLADLGSLSAQQADYYNSKATASYVQGALGGAFNLTRLFKGKPKPVLTSPTNGQLAPDNFSGHATTQPARGNLEFYIGLGLIAFDASASSLTTGKLQRYTNGTGSHHTESDNVTAKGPGNLGLTRELVVPLGLRYNRSLNATLSLYADLRYNFVASDKLDATRENDNSTIDTPQGGAIFGKAVLNTSRDKWASLSIGLAYQFKRKVSANRIRSTDF
ncbi:hypothetical protein [Fibrella aquatilis]|uniref:Outer membrane protein beta-barrel domain-containing protein n=1 Tax=Fibrella aquatilis TaxID=2817059 RepID=A0A939G7Y2_9BACT|nr:hypothetical protein [Fibrella aquatilis]MBO0933526.1 hypothetical protein [Fibrella aquatilis]